MSSSAHGATATLNPYVRAGWKCAITDCPDTDINVILADEDGEVDAAICCDNTRGQVLWSWLSCDTFPVRKPLCWKDFPPHPHHER